MTATISPIYTAEMRDLNELFNDLQKPYGHDEIARFNYGYQGIYTNLSRTERFRAEKLVDALLENLKDEGLASKVYGVV